MSRPVAVCVSGRGSNLRALHRQAASGSLGGEICLVLADRDCPALEFARENGTRCALVSPRDHAGPGAWDRAVASTLAAAQPDVVVLAGFMRRLGAPVLEAFPASILNVHPSLLPAFPGAHAVRDALAAGARVTGVTVHLVDETLDGGPIVAQEAVDILPTDDEATLAERLHTVEHRLLPRAVALALAGGLIVDGRQVRVDAAIAASLPMRRRALLSVSDKTWLVELAAELTALGFELVSTGGTARALRDAGHEVTDVAAVTGFPEMLDGRVKTLHPRIAAGVLADLSRQEHREALVLAAIEPFELVVVNLYPFEAAAAKADLSIEALIEEIDIGGPTLVRAAAKNHASVAIVTDPADYAAVAAELRDSGRLSDAIRKRLAVKAFERTAEYDRHIATTLADRLGEAPLERFPARWRLDLERLADLRYGENPHQAAAAYRLVPGADTPRLSGSFAHGVDLVQGKPLSYNNLLDGAAAAGIARDLRSPGCVIVKHTNPCGAAEAAEPMAAWEAALAGDPVSAFGGVVALNTPITPELAERLTSLFLEVILAPGIEDGAVAILATKPNLRVIRDPGLAAPAQPALELRTVSGALLVSDSDTQPDDPGTWRVATSRAPTPDEQRDLELAWRLCRHVKSNAILLVREGVLVGVGAGQMSRVDSARLAVSKAGPERVVGAACASDAFYPFPDGVEVCTQAGVTAFVQPGGSQRDADVIAAAEAAGATMLLTGTRHFRH
ncbi:MAG: bifunctional phosphoribosylaminoimidazolecarboxamide formyltransferase/IMP cyclohydrolase [Chloroflexi bacterium]|nr:bifunctional phosphoribosylaminoimidazolecarboxamide formyltransferase/IMP cyclohydrolase [Chloroflexota bacterium]